MNRRNFFTKAALGAGSALILGSSLKSRAEDAPKKDMKPAGAVITRTLGRTGIQVPIVSMGVMNADNPELLRQSYLTGIRHFDTAWYYQRGNNEKMVGAVLKEVCPKRENVVVSTKIYLNENPKNVPTGQAAKDTFLKRFDQSLSRLQMDYVDILYYHALASRDQALDPYIIEALTELKAQKKIRYTGISTHVHWPEFLPAVADQGFYDVALLSFNYSMSGDPAFLNAARYARSKGMGLVAMKTQCQQAWYRRMLPGAVQKFYEGQVMHGALLKWVLRHEEFATAVPGYTTFQQLEEDFVVARSLEYTPEEKRFLEDRNVKVAMQGNCQICGKCTGSCPKGADIPNLMRTHMYAYSYGNAPKARETLDEIDPSAGLQACSECPTCVAQCVRSVDIARRVDDLKVLYV